MFDFKKYQSKIKKFFSSGRYAILTGIILVTAGAVLLLFPIDSLVVLCIIMGAAAAVWGITKLFKYYREKKIELEHPVDLFSGIALLVSALSLILHPSGIISFLPVMTGLTLALIGASSLLSKKGNGKLVPVITLVLGIFLILNPFRSAAVVVKILGGVFLILGILRLIKGFANREKKTKKPKSDDGYKEVEFKDI